MVTGSNVTPAISGRIWSATVSLRGRPETCILNVAYVNTRNLVGMLFALHVYAQRTRPALNASMQNHLPTSHPTVISPLSSSCATLKLILKMKSRPHSATSCSGRACVSLGRENPYDKATLPCLPVQLEPNTPRLSNAITNRPP